MHRNLKVRFLSETVTLPSTTAKGNANFKKMDKTIMKLEKLSINMHQNLCKSKYMAPATNIRPDAKQLQIPDYTHEVKL